MFQTDTHCVFIKLQPLKSAKEGVHNEECFSDPRLLTKHGSGDILTWPVTPGDVSIGLTKDIPSFVHCEMLLKNFFCKCLHMQKKEEENSLLQII